MIIVSQDRDRICNFKNIGYIEIAADNKTLRCQILDENIFLGTYATKERAMEVLREIYNFYEVTQRYGCSSYNGINIFLEKKFVYEMPEE